MPHETSSTEVFLFKKWDILPVYFSHSLYLKAAFLSCVNLNMGLMLLCFLEESAIKPFTEVILHRTR